ncbi:MAG: hypothetical protein ACYDEV_08630 [Acidiferrobacter sp.]
MHRIDRDTGVRRQFAYEQGPRRAAYFLLGFRQVSQPRPAFVVSATRLVVGRHPKRPIVEVFDMARHLLLRLSYGKTLSHTDI